MKKSQVEAKNRKPNPARAVIGLGSIGIALSWLSSFARWICLAQVMQPHGMVPQVNLARWIWIVVALLPTIFILLLNLVMRSVSPVPAPPLFNRGFLSAIYSLVTIIAVMMGRLPLALLLSYFYGSFESGRTLRVAPPKTPPQYRRIQQVGACLGVLFFPLLAGALMMHSFFIAWILVGAEVARTFVEIPLIKDAISPENSP